MVMKKYILFLFSNIFILILTTKNSFAAGGDLLSVDKTILFQFVVVILGLFIINKLILQPMLSLLDRREKLTKGTVDEARELTEKAENLINDYKQKIDEARAEANEKRAEIRKEAQLISEKMISEARDESHATLENYKKELDVQVTDIKSKIKPEIENLAKEISDKVLSMEG